MDKAAELNALKEKLEADRSLPLADQANLVFGEGNPEGGIMFIGEAPGFNEDKLKRPFVGRGGQLLNEMIAGLGWKREEVYITNIVKRRPPNNRDPFPEEIAAYRPFLARQIEIIKPKLIVTLGRFAMNYFVPQAKMTRDHGRALLIDGQIVFPVYHPAAALRSGEMMRVLREDFQKIPRVRAGEMVAEIPPAIVPKVTADPFEIHPKKKEKRGDKKETNPPAQEGLF